MITCYACYQTPTTKFLCVCNARDVCRVLHIVRKLHPKADHPAFHTHTRASTQKQTHTGCKSLPPHLSR